jgi:cysteinyl-tRNA synthetase
MIKLYNSLTKKKEEFIPIKKGEIKIYSCGPTVYSIQHIGNMRAMLIWDFLKKMFRYFNYNVIDVINITDVGHLTSDEDSGEDKMEKGAKKDNI